MRSRFVFPLLLTIALMFACHFIVDIPDESPAWGDADVDGDSDVDADVDSDVDSDVESDVDSDTDGDADSDVDFDSYCEITGDYICRGHPDMVRIPDSGFCIDRYEASRGVGNVAKSLPGEFPWVNVSYAKAAEACDNAEKRLCTDIEWRTACQGPDTTTYPYGNDFSGTACNGAEYDAGIILDTGTMSGCEGGYDCIFDMSGNVDEWVSGDCPGTSCRVYGGTYEAEETNLQCASSFSTSDDGGDDIGFRCCVDD